MRLRLVALTLGVCLALPLAAAPVSLLHDEYLPEDIYGQRLDRPEQVLFEVQRYSLTVGSELRPGARPNEAQAGISLLLEGPSLLPGSPVQRARLQFSDGAGGQRGARLVEAGTLLLINYPQAMLPIIRQMLDSPGKDYVQGRFYGNGLIWADVHSEPAAAAD